MKKLYKKKYIICFYDIDTEVLLFVFDNVRDILKFQKKELTRQNINVINVELYRTLRRKDKTTKFLNGKLMEICIVDV